MDDKGVLAGWCDERTPGEWQALWEARYHDVDEAVRYWLAYRSYPELFSGSEVSSSWADDPAADWGTLTRTLRLACNSEERRFLMNDVLWGAALLFLGPGLDSFTAAPRDDERLWWLLGFGAGDHVFRGDMMWNLVSEERVMPEEIQPCPGDMDEFVRRYPSRRLWLADCGELDRGEGFLSEYNSIPERMKCAVGVLAYKDDWYGDSTWASAIARYRQRASRA